MAVDHWPCPTHDQRPNALLWSRANMAEAIPGVATTLTWTFWEHGFTAANRDLWSALGVLSPQEASVPQGVRPEDDFVSIFFGRPVVNVDRVRDLFARVPGGDPDHFELQMLGSVRPGVRSPRSARRWPHLAASAPRHVRRLEAKVADLSQVTDRWWRAATLRPLDTPVAARAALRGAVEVFDRVQLLHGLCLMTGQIAYERVAAICRRAGHADLVLELATAGGRTHESALIADLWSAAAGRTSIPAVVGRHGYHGPDEGALDARSWREDPTPLESIVARYQVLGSRSAADVQGRRAAAAATVTAAFPRVVRPAVRKLVLSAGANVVRRETTKAAFLQAIDGARRAARELGRHLAAAGALEDAEHVFHLTLREAGDPRHRIDPGVIGERITRWHEYQELDVPTSFIGRPSAFRPGAVTAARARHLEGVGASAGRAEGPARIVVDPSGGDALAPGEVLVCRQTDPAWVPLFQIAAAVVVEIGGPLSHAAIVAREMGVPCVVAVHAATQRIVDGALVRVDGSNGLVEVLT